jgi:hypothetical protein
MRSIVFVVVLIVSMVALGSAQTAAPALFRATSVSSDAGGTRLVGNVVINVGGVRVTADEADSTLTSDGREIVLRGSVRMLLSPQTTTFVRADRP